MLNANPLGRLVNNYLMKMALPLAGWFIAEYLLNNAAIHSTVFDTASATLYCLCVVLMPVTPVLAWAILRKLRTDVLSNMMLGLQAWVFGVQLAFFAGLIEALFIYLYNGFMNPANLSTIYEAQQLLLTDMIDRLAAMGVASSDYTTMIDAQLDMLRQMSVPTAIETAISALSKEIFAAMIYMIPVSLIVRRRIRIS